MLEGGGDASKAGGCGYGGDVWGDGFKIIRKGGVRDVGGSGKL